MKNYLNLIEAALSEQTLDYDKTKVQPALMTLPEYLSHRNPRGKMHDHSAYQTTIDDLNQDMTRTFLNRVIHALPYRNGRLSVWSNEKSGKDLFMVARIQTSSNDTAVAAFLDKGVAQYDPLLIDEGTLASIFEDVTEYQKTKYIETQYKQALRKTQDHRANSKLLKRFRISNGEYIEIRQKQDDFADMNAYNEEGLKVGAAQDEWGAVLVMVAAEYKGFGIGRILQKLYTDTFPNKESGGFTPSGLSNAKKVWQKEVRKFLAGGVYSNMVRKGHMSKEKVDSILSGLDGDVKIDQFLPKKVEQKSKSYLIYYNGSNAFILYDKEYLINQDDKYIYAYAHFEESHDSGMLYPYRIEYEADKDRQTILYIVLQELENIDTNFAGSDYFKYDDLEYAQDDSGVLSLKKNVFSNLEGLYAKERRLRSDVDQYSELLYTLLEDAEAKWK